MPLFLLQLSNYSKNFTHCKWIDFECYDESYIERIVNKETSSMTLKVKEHGSWKTVCSKVAFKEGVHVWKLKCLQYGGLLVDAIGIVEKAKPKIWYNKSGKAEDTMGQVYYAFNSFFFEFQNGKQTQKLILKDIGKESQWRTGDELIMTLDFNQATFTITRQRENEEDVVWSIGINNTRSYRPSIGFGKLGPEYELVLL